MTHASGKAALRRRKAGTAALLLLGVSAGAMWPTCAMAENPAVKALLQQARYWQSKGRGDLADQALRRAQAIDPDNAEVKRAQAGGPAPQVKTAPQAKAPPQASTRSKAPAPRREKAASANADTGGQARVAGFAALQANDLATANRQFESAFARNHRDADALGGLGLVALKQGNFAKAREYLEQSSRLGDAAKWAEALASAKYYAGLGDAQNLAARGQLADAQKMAEDLVRTGGARNETALELLADIYDRQGRYADAADLYRQASTHGKEGDKRLASRAARGRALAAAGRGDDIAAEQEFQQGLMLDTEDPWIRYEFARFMIKRGRVAEAESLIQALSSSTDPDALYAAAMVDSDLGRIAAAEALIQRIPEIYQTQPMRAFAVGLKTDTAIARAKTLAAGGRKGEAAAALRQLGQTRGLPAARQAAIADALYEMGDTTDAATLAQQALAGSITDLGGYEAIIRVATKTGRDDLAQTAFQRATQLAGASSDGQAALTRIGAGMAASQADRLRLQGQYAQAFDVLQQAWGSAPDNAEILAGLARLYQAGNMPARAAQTFQIILARTPRDREALGGLMETAQAAGDRGLSQQAQARLLQAYPDNYEVYLSVARTEQARGNVGAATKYLKLARELYSRQMTAPGLGGNPFAGTGTGLGTNPFRNMAAAPAPQPVNPFSLGGGTRLPATTGMAFDAGNGGAQTGFAPQGGGAVMAQGGVQGVALGAGQAGPWNAPTTPTGQFGGQAVGGWGAGAAPSPSPTPAASSVPVDPVLAQIQTDIANLSQDSGPRGEVHAAYRARSGETGLSELREVKGTAELSTGLGGGRVYVRGDATVIDAGRPTGSGLARFGRNATIEAQAIVDKVASALKQADTQRKSGVAISAGYADKLVQVEGGVTPLGFGNNKATWRAAITPQLAQNVSARAWFERKPVTDSVVSYAGTRDPVTGEFWGRVMRTGGGVGVSIDHDGSGVYGDVAYNHYAGLNVLSNHNVEANLGGYLRVRHTVHSNLTAGLNINYQTYGNNQNFFTYGQGGYFSPQSFLSLGFPINYTYESPKVDIKGSFTPGFQSFSQDKVNLYTTDPTAQATLDGLKAEDSDVRNYYDSLSKTGFALSAEGSAYYRVTSSTRIGGEISYNTFGNYDEFRSMLGIRQTLGSTK
ncbi:cellulose synthase protein C precursor [Novosphingobium nitrogenifigens DSM 19370]|uniref:Cellulose synthase protein C n=1 Tax=Novosphingobium nitrogenifigens DSM 19370 TaxID=983920 RepID=F1Z4Y6_9SPHN|nr:cellulose biosynthesis protein BcsC [Novosphingobium nitrogenifigens]EGD59977.1 cellulose synthase protein C precursor [Novosphingobium nitrogenifigens DSM 19370]